MRIRAVSLILLLSLTGNAVPTAKADAPTSKNNDLLAYRELVRVDMFGFGGLGSLAGPRLGSWPSERL